MSIDTCKVLTLWEPWATLFVHNLKKYETRPATTNHKGIYLIHAAMKMDKFQKDACQLEPFSSALNSIGIKDYKDLKPGHIIGAYTQLHCYRIIPESSNVYQWISLWNVNSVVKESEIIVCSSNEYYFGDFSKGRFAWEGTGKQVFNNPIPYKNGQGYYQPYRGDKQLVLDQLTKTLE